VNFSNTPSSVNSVRRLSCSLRIRPPNETSCRPRPAIPRDRCRVCDKLEISRRKIVADDADQPDWAEEAGRHGSVTGRTARRRRFSANGVLMESRAVEPTIRTSSRGDARRSLKRWQASSTSGARRMATPHRSACPGFQHILHGLEIDAPMANHGIDTWAAPNGHSRESLAGARFGGSRVDGADAM